MDKEPPEPFCRVSEAPRTRSQGMNRQHSETGQGRNREGIATPVAEADPQHLDVPLLNEDAGRCASFFFLRVGILV